MFNNSEVIFTVVNNDTLFINNAKVIVPDVMASNGIIHAIDTVITPPMPTTIDAINLLIDNGVIYSPGKASNAGGVATSGLEMTQNYMGANWTSAEVDIKLHEIMKNIHQTCLAAAKEYGKPGNYLVGANIAGFLKVAKAMQAQGVV